jgi:hypothetical protein
MMTTTQEPACVIIELMSRFEMSKRNGQWRLTCISAAISTAAPVGTTEEGLAAARDVEDKVFDGDVRQSDGMPPVAVNAFQV